MKRQLFFLAATALLVFSLAGCRTGLPDGLPKLYSCHVGIVDKAGAPIDNATVVAVLPGSKWAGIGLTDSDGIAVLKTNGIYPGVPAGTYKITVTKYDVKVLRTGPDGEATEIAETLVLDKSFADEATTPLELTVEAKTNNATFEVF